MVTPFFICVFTCYGYTKNIYSKEEKIWKVEVYIFLQDNVKIIHISTFLSR